MPKLKKDEIKKYYMFEDVAIGEFRLEPTSNKEKCYIRFTNFQKYKAEMEKKIKRSEVFITFQKRRVNLLALLVEQKDKEIKKYQQEYEKLDDRWKQSEDIFNLQLQQKDKDYKAKMQTLIWEIDKIINNWQSELIGDIRDLKKQIKQKIKEMMK